MTGPSAFRGSNSSGSAPINPKIKTLNLRTMRERSAKAGLNPWRFRRVMLATFSLFENASKIAIFRLKIFGCIKTFLDSLFKYYLDADRISTLPLKTFEKMCKLPNIFNLQNQQNSFFNNFLNLEKCNKSHKKKYKIALNHRLLAVFYGVSFWPVPYEIRGTCHFLPKSTISAKNTWNSKFQIASN